MKDKFKDTKGLDKAYMSLAKHYDEHKENAIRQVKDSAFVDLFNNEIEELQKVRTIEEIAKDIHRVCTACSGEMFDEYTCDRCQAKLLIKKGYRKIDKDSVVLSREEYEKLKAENDKYVKDCIDYIATISKLENKVWEVEQQARKETAENLFNTIIQALEEKKDRIRAFYGVDESVGMDIAIKTVQELAKQSEVEIKE